MRAKQVVERQGLRGLVVTGVAVAVAAAYMLVAGALIGTLSSIAAGMTGAAVFLVITTVIVALVAASAVSTTLRASLAARLRETGLTRALGASGSHIRKSLLKQAAIIGIAGSVVGVIAGFGLVLAGAAIATAVGATFTVAMPSILFVGIALGVGVLVTLFGVARPAIEVGRVSPVQAMVSAEMVDTDIAKSRVASKTVNVVMLAASGVLLAIAMAGGVAAMSSLIAGILLCACVVRTSPTVMTALARCLPRSGKTTLGLAAESIRRLPKRAGALLSLVVACTATVGTLVLIATALMQLPMMGAGFVATLMVIIATMIVGTLLLAATAFTGASIASIRSRAQELGVLRAIGLTRRRMVGMLTLEAGVVGLFGAILGSAIALAVIGAALMGTTMSISFLGVGMIVAMIIATTLVAATATVIPAARVTS